jgi:hypothetical protein
MFCSVYRRLPHVERALRSNICVSWLNSLFMTTTWTWWLLGASAGVLCRMQDFEGQCTFVYASFRRREMPFQDFFGTPCKFLPVFSLRNSILRRWVLRSGDLIGDHPTSPLARVCACNATLSRAGDAICYCQHQRMHPSTGLMSHCLRFR